MQTVSSNRAPGFKASTPNLQTATRTPAEIAAKPRPLEPLPLIAHLDLLRRAHERGAFLLLGAGYAQAAIFVDDQPDGIAVREPRRIWTGSSLVARSAIRLRLLEPLSRAGKILKFGITADGKTTLAALLREAQAAKALRRELEDFGLHSGEKRRTLDVAAPPAIAPAQPQPPAEPRANPPRATRRMTPWELEIFDLLTAAGDTPVDARDLMAVPSYPPSYPIRYVVHHLRRNGLDVMRVGAAFVIARRRP